jgi:hypothetical protein
MAEVGPDGNVWFIDWYNFIVQHNPTPQGFRTGRGAAYETDLRDKKHGRIYRLVYKSAKPAAPYTLKDAPPEKLVATLKHDNMFWRLHAQRLLVEGGKLDVVPALVKLVNDRGVDEIGLNVGAVHALWTLHGLAAFGDKVKVAGLAAVAALKHPSRGVRRSAALVLPRDRNAMTSLLASGALNDADPHVRLAAFLALAEIPASEVAGADIARALDRPDNLSDRWLPHAITAAAASHGIPFLKSVAARPAAPAESGLQIVARVAEHGARDGHPGTAGDFIDCLGGEPKAAEVILAAVAKGWPKDKRADLTAGMERALDRLFTRAGPEAKGQLVQLAATWGTKALEKHAGAVVETLLAVAADEKGDDDRRLTAARQVMSFRAEDAGAAGKLLDLVGPRTPPALAVGLIDAAGTSRSSAVGPLLVARCRGWSPSTRAAVIRTLLSRAALTRALLDAFDQGSLQLGELTLDQKQALAAHPDAALAERA